MFYYCVSARVYYAIDFKSTNAIIEYRFRVNVCVCVYVVHIYCLVSIDVCECDYAASSGFIACFHL